MMPLSLLPFAVFLIVLPIPGTVAARLLLLAICASIALWQWWRHPAARAKIPCKPAIGVWAAVCIASLFYSADVPYSLGEVKNEVGYSMLAFFAFFVAAKEHEHAVWLARAAALGLTFIAAWAITAWAVSGLVWQETSGYGGMGVIATYVVTVLPVLVWLALGERRAGARRMAIGTSALALVLALIAGQRAAWVVLASQAVIGLLLLKRSRAIELSWRRMSISLLVVAAIAASGLFYGQTSRFSENPDPKTRITTDVRLDFWPSVAAKIAEHPLAGAGFGRSMMRKAYPELIPADRPLLWHAHNVVLNYGLQLGVPGMLALLLLFGSIGAFFWPAAGGTAAIAGFTVLAGVLLRNQFNDFFFRDMSLLFWALTGLLARRVIAAQFDSPSNAEAPGRVPAT